MQSTLPEELEEVKISDLLIGESAYTVCWAMKVDEQGRLWIKDSFGFSSRSFGTVHMKITRQKDHIEVDKHTIDQTYSRQHLDNLDFYLPVVLV